MLRSIAAAELPPLSSYPMSEQVTFSYYTGVLAFLDENYSRAEECLSFALSHSPSENSPVKRRNQM
jgi:hypothetical protein